MLDPFNTRTLASGNVALLDPTGRLVLTVLPAATVAKLQDDELQAQHEAEAWEDACKAEEANERYWEDRGNYAGSQEDAYDRWLDGLAAR